MFFFYDVCILKRKLKVGMPHYKYVIEINDNIFMIIYVNKIHTYQIDNLYLKQ